MTTREDLRSVLAAAVGPADADRALEALVAAYGGERLYIPARAPVDAPALRLAAYVGTRTRAELAREHRISTKTLQRLMRSV